jgi:hypothetical protein
VKLSFITARQDDRDMKLFSDFTEICIKKDYTDVNITE